MSEKPTIVIDNGSSMLKVGYGNEDLPKVVIPSVIGRPRHVGVMLHACEKLIYVGDEAQKIRGILSLKYPIDRGVVENWENMEEIWRYAICSALRVEPSEHSMLLTETPMNPLTNRERMTQIMFESFNVPSLFVAIQGVLSLYFSGRTTGVVLDSGNGITYTLPVYEGNSIPSAVNRFDLAGHDLTQYLKTLLNQSGYSFSTSAEMEIVRDIKEKICYVADRETVESTTYKDSELKTYFLPDGCKVELQKEAFRCPEALFDPTVLGKAIPGLHIALNNCILKTDINIRRKMYGNIVLGGGTTMLPGIANRIYTELCALKPVNYKVNITMRPERLYSAWIGGSILASLPSFPKIIISKTEYDECGPTIVHRKCF